MLVSHALLNPYFEEQKYALALEMSTYLWAQTYS